MKKKLIVHIIIGVIPVALFTLFYVYFSQNILILDDYNMIGTPFIESLKSSSLLGKVKTMFSQQNEYRFPLLATISLIQYQLFGKLNFTYYIFIGNLIVYSICFLLFYIWREKIKIRTFLPVIYLVFPLHIFIIITWANASCQYLCALGYSIFTIFLLLNDTKIKYWAFLTAFFAVFSFGSGLLSLLFGILILASKANYKLMIAWVAYSAIIFILYFTDYTAGSGLINYALESIRDNPLNIPKGFLWIYGGWSDLFIDESNPVRLGLVGFLGFCTFMLSMYVVYQSFWKLKNNENYLQNTFIFFVILLLIATVSLIAVGRSGTNPERNSIISNYRYYGFLELALIYLYFSINMSKKVQYSILFCSVILFFSGFYKYSIAMSERAKIIVTDRTSYYLNFDLQTNNKHEAFQRSVDADLVRLKAYSFPATELQREWKTITSKIGGDLKTKQTIDNNDSPYVSITDESFDEQSINHLGLYGIYFVLKSENRTLIFPAKNSFKSFKFWKSYRNKVVANIEKKILGTDTYKVYLCLYQNNKIKYFTTNKIIKV